ncbi:MAG: thioredoxin [Flavobacteriales bacterium CG_4_10_14_0_8_um_filter_32_5]|nr:MAG: thioredoxin [Flavobacteriales bacterium CG_4_10_14_0_8_um_filter_32_5]
MKTFVKIVAAIIVLSSCNNNQAQQSVSIIENADAKQFKELVDAGKGIILDVRTPEEVSEGYINNASTINLYDDDFIAKINLIQKDKQIYVYCKSGGRSSEAAELLKKNGFSKVYNLKGGISEWENNSFPIVKPDGTKDEKIQQITLANFKSLLATDKPVLVDFHTIWCSPCRKLAPIIDGIEDKFKDKAVVMRIDVDKSKEVGKAYKIQGVPVFILFKNGKEIWKHNGMISEEELKKQIENNL